MFACRSVGAMQVSFGWQPLLTQETGMQVRMGKIIDVILLEAPSRNILELSHFRCKVEACLMCSTLVS